MTCPARPTSEDAARFIAGMQRISPAPLEDLKEALESARVTELDVGEHVLRGGDVASHSGIVLSGLLREYFVMPDGTERTKAFVQAGEATGSLADLLSGQPSRAFIVAHEPTRMLQVPFDALRERGHRSLTWLTWYVQFLEQMFVRKAEREYELLGLDAQQRYASFAQRYPGLEARVAARHVASYLGITPVHLSRIRRRRRPQLQV